MQKPFTLGVWGQDWTPESHWNIIRTHHLKQFQDLKHAYITHSSLSLFRCSVKGSSNLKTIQPILPGSGPCPSPRDSQCEYTMRRKFFQEHFWLTLIFKKFGYNEFAILFTLITPKNTWNMMKSFCNRWSCRNKFPCIYCKLCFESVIRLRQLTKFSVCHICKRTRLD